MGYFDSPKNRALWEKELESLDAERRRRKEEGYRPGPGAGSAGGAGISGNAGNPKVRRITLKMLEEIEKAARKQQKAPRASEPIVSDRRRKAQMSRETKEMLMQ